MERHEIITGSLSLGVVSILTGTITWYAANDGTYLTVYYRIEDYGWIWFFLQIPIVFIYQVCLRMHGISAWNKNGKFFCRTIQRIGCIVFITIHICTRHSTKFIINMCSRQRSPWQPFIQWKFSMFNSLWPCRCSSFPFIGVRILSRSAETWKNVCRILFETDLCISMNVFDNVWQKYQNNSKRLHHRGFCRIA